jgi:hypothetical protein
MAHGTPDYGITAGRATTHQLTDLGELAVRMGSPIRFDRRGDVMWWDDFECVTNRYDNTLEGTGAAAARSTVRAHSGENSWLLTGGSDGLRLASLTASEPPIVRAAVGLEIAFNLPGVVDAVQLRITEFDGAAFYTARLIWSDVTNELLYYNAAAGETVIASGIDLPVNLPTWCIVKLVVDLQTRTYVRALLNHQAFDLSGIAMNTGADARAPRVDFIPLVVSRAGNNDQAYFDDLVVTQNEPL